MSPIGTFSTTLSKMPSYLTSDARVVRYPWAMKRSKMPERQTNSRMAAITIVCQVSARWALRIDALSCPTHINSRGGASIGCAGTFGIMWPRGPMRDADRCLSLDRSTHRSTSKTSRPSSFRTRRHCTSSPGQSDRIQIAVVDLADLIEVAMGNDRTVAVGHH